ncbi:MAG: hypothetical protein QXX08_06855 [Candidatus Bathyarchaeia archaeon]
MKKTLTIKGIAYVISGFMAIIVGIWMYLTISEPFAKNYGLFVLIFGLVLIAVGLRNKMVVVEEREKPLMDVTTFSPKTRLVMLKLHV